MEYAKKVNEPAPRDRYVIVPVAWFEQLTKLRDMSTESDKIGKQFLLGYLSSVETILETARRVDIP